MEKKRYLLGFLVMVLVFSLAFTGCDEPKDEWSAVTNLSQLNGRWVGSHSETITFMEFIGDDMDITVTMVLTIDATVNASAGTGSTKMTMAMTFSGSDLTDEMWALLVLSLDVPGVGVNFNDTTKTISMTEIDEGPLNISDWEGLEINQDGTKIRMLIPMGEELVTMVLNKQ
jgi:hypothetical protein